MGSFFHFGSASYKDNNNIGDGTLSKILEYERSIPSSYKDLELKTDIISYLNYQNVQSLPYINCSTILQKD